MVQIALTSSYCAGTALSNIHTRLTFCAAPKATPVRAAPTRKIRTPTKLWAGTPGSDGVRRLSRPARLSPVAGLSRRSVHQSGGSTARHCYRHRSGASSHRAKAPSDAAVGVRSSYRRRRRGRCTGACSCYWCYECKSATRRQP
jgi:hypothetical protein